MRSTTIPILRYRDAGTAIEWLCRAFGFEIFLRVPGAEGRIEHARLVLADNMIMLASLGRHGGLFEEGFRAPADAGGVTQCVSLCVPDPDGVYRSACASGARVIDEIKDFEFGGRLFSCADLEHHVWIFGSHDPWRKLW